MSSQRSPSAADSPWNALHTVKLGFSLPVTSDFLFFVNDTIAFSSFLVDAVESTSSDVEVDMVLSYHTPEAPQRSRVSLSEQGSECIIGVTGNAEASETALGINFRTMTFMFGLPFRVTSNDLCTS